MTMTITQAARKGGMAMAREHRDDNYYEKIGQKGGEKTRDEYGSRFYAEIGRKGGKRRSENWVKKKASERI